MQQLNPELKIVPFDLRITSQNALDVFKDYDLIVDGTDNFSSRYMINDACVLLNKVLVYGAISQFEGQVSVFNFKSDPAIRAINYRDLFPHPPGENEVLNCAEAGVLGVLPGIIGCMLANETIKLITGMGQPLNDRLLTYNALTNDVYVLNLSVNVEAGALVPKTETEFQQTDYDWLCASHQNKMFEINSDEFDHLLAADNVTIVDVREKGEQPPVHEFKHQHIPVSLLKEKQSSLEADSIVLFCQTGRRSLQAAIMLDEIFGGSKRIYSLAGGIIEWKKTKQ